MQAKLKLERLNPHSTKKGPGRIHKNGMPHGAPPVAPKGAPLGFVLHKNPAKAQRRAAISAFGGIRQFKKFMRAVV